MTAKLTIAMDDDLLNALRASGHITLTLTSGGKGGPARPPKQDGAPREGSLPARLIDWAAKHGKAFGTKDIVKAFRLSRAHASMLLSRAASTGLIGRLARGKYAPKGAPATASTEAAPKRSGKKSKKSSAPKPKGGPREGSLPAKLAAWAGKREGTFGVADVVKALKVRRSHANMVLTKVVRDGIVVREGRGVYSAGT